jgi:DNA topoisomerase I
MFGDDYVADAPRRYDRKVKNAQEAHEAIRPAGETFRSLDEAQSQLGGDELAVYDLIWKRTLASQMVDARLTQDKVRLESTLRGVAGFDADVRVGSARRGCASSSPAFVGPTSRAPTTPRPSWPTRSASCRRSPRAKSVPVTSAEAKGHDTQPPDRYSEATLIKKLEDLGIGRPSTYASVMKTIDRRGYVWKKGKSLVPAFRAFAVVNLLQQYFADLVDYQFTAAMEDELDEIAQGNQDLEPWLRKFYFGDPTATTELAKLGLEHMTHEPHEFDFAAINSIPLGVAADGVAVSVRSGRYGPYLVHGEDRVSIPEATEPDSLSVAKALELLSAPSNDRELGVDEETGLPIFLKAGRYGPYVQVGEMTDPKEKPKTASLLTTMSPRPSRSPTRRNCCRCRASSANTPNGESIIAQNGRYGPYLTWGKETRSLEDEEQIFTIDLAGGAGVARPTQAARASRGGRTAEGTRRGPGHQTQRRRAHRSLRPVRHRRRDQRHPATGRHARDHHAGPRL